jgi:hypothetical protein
MLLNSTSHLIFADALKLAIQGPSLPLGDRVVHFHARPQKAALLDRMHPGEEFVRFCRVPARLALFDDPITQDILEVITFEAKLPSNLDIRGIHEASAHRRLSTIPKPSSR